MNARYSQKLHLMQRQAKGKKTQNPAVTGGVLDFSTRSSNIELSTASSIRDTVA
jgi:hypothetical protein